MALRSRPPKQELLDSDAALSESSALTSEHCGWLLTGARRAVVEDALGTGQAGCLWYFKDDSRQRLPGACHSPQQLWSRLNPASVCRRTLLLVAADETEARAWVRVLTRCITDVTLSTQQASHKAEALSNARSGARSGLPQTVADLDELLSLLLPPTVALVEARLPSPDHANAAFPAMSAAQEESLSVVLLTIHTMARLSHGSPSCFSLHNVEGRGASHEHRQFVFFAAYAMWRIAYILLRWAQLHPHHFAEVDGATSCASWRSAGRWLSV